MPQAALVRLLNCGDGEADGDVCLGALQLPVGLHQRDEALGILGRRDALPPTAAVTAAAIAAASVLAAAPAAGIVAAAGIAAAAVTAAPAAVTAAATAAPDTK